MYRENAGCADTRRVLIPYDEAADVGDRFLDLLRQLSIDPSRSTALEDELLSLTALIDIWKDPSIANSHRDPNAILRSAAGIHDLAAKVLCAAALPEFPVFHKHLELLAGKNRFAKSFTLVAQNVVNDIRDDVARKMAELYVACLAIHCGHDIALDDPVDSKGNNPDVMLTYHGQRWTLAVKTLGSRQGQTIFENIESAAGQIERSEADAGLVVINTKNVIAHSRLWNPIQPYGTLGQAMEALDDELEQIIQLLEKDRPQSDWDRVFTGPKAVMPIIFMGQSITALGIATAVVPTPLRMMKIYWNGKTPHPVGAELATCLNHWLQLLLKGQPGPPPQ